MLGKKCDFLLGVISVFIQRHNYRLSETLHIPDMAVEIGKAFDKSLTLLFVRLTPNESPMHLQSTQSRNKNRNTRMYFALPAFDVQEFLCSKVSTESCFSHGVITQ